MTNQISQNICYTKKGNPYIKTSAKKKAMYAAGASVTGLALYADKLDHAFETTGFKGNLIENIKTFVNSKPGFIDMIEDLFIDTTHEVDGTKKTLLEKFYTKVLNTKSGKVGLLAAGAALCVGVAVGTSALTQKLRDVKSAKNADKLAELTNKQNAD